MAAHDPCAQFLKALPNQGASVKVLPGSNDEIDRIQVGSKRRAVHGLNEFYITVHTVRKRPLHHFQGELGLAWFNLIQYLANGIYRKMKVSLERLSGCGP